MTQLVQFNNVWYQLVHKIRTSQVNGNMSGLKAWRDQLNCDHVLQNGEYYLLVRYVDEVEFEEIELENK